MNDYITTTKQSTTKPCAYFLGYTVYLCPANEICRNTRSHWLGTNSLERYNVSRTSYYGLLKYYVPVTDPSGKNQPSHSQTAKERPDYIIFIKGLRLKDTILQFKYMFFKCGPLSGIRSFYTGFDTLRPRQNGRYFTDRIFRCICYDNIWSSITISLSFVPKDPINDIQELVQIMAWHRPGDKPLSEPMMVSILTHICVTRT